MSLCRHGTSRSPGKRGTEFVILYRFHRVWTGTSRAHGVLLRQNRGDRHTMKARARFVNQSLDTFLQKSLHPLIDKAPADPDRGGYVGERHAIGDEYNNPAPAGTPRRNGGGPLPR